MFWNPPQYDTTTPPALELSEHVAHSSEDLQNFPRIAKWSPDGSTVLCQCENRTFERLDLPQEILAGNEQRNVHCKHEIFLQPSPILDFVWYPGATRNDPASFCFLASIRECPVKLFDASDGRLRASYRIIDHRERHVAPHSLAFNMMANKVYCGFEDAIEVFDIHCPGEGIRLPTTPSKKSKDGLKGIVSALAFSSSHEIYAAGSLTSSTSNIALFSESENHPVMFVSADVKAAVTQLHFNPIKPHMLYASFRQQESIYAWDIRANVSVPAQILQRNPPEMAPRTDTDLGNIDHCPPRSLQRSRMTNQKMRFDVDLGGKWLGVGDQSGIISLFDLNGTEGRESDMQDEESPSTDGITPSLRYEAHGDAIGSVEFHPLHPLLLSVSGSRHFTDESDGSESSDDEGGSTSVEADVRRRTKRQPVPRDSSIKLWNFSKPK